MRREDALEAFASHDPVVVSEALVAVALHDEDAAWVEEQCRRLAAHDDAGIRGTAGLCLGHVARRFGVVAEESWRLVEDLCDDPAVDGRPCDALDDLRQFATRRER